MNKFKPYKAQQVGAWSFPQTVARNYPSPKRPSFRIVWDKRG
jgi:hypothetical protein